MKKTKSPDDPLEQSVQFLKGVGPKRAQMFEKLGVRNIADLIWYFPLRYEDRTSVKTISEVEIDKVETIRAIVKSAGSVPTKSRKRIFEVAFADKTGVLRGTWFHFGEKSFLQKFAIGTEWIVSGKVSFNSFRRAKTMIHPDVEEVKEEAEGESLHLGRIAPIYGLTEGIVQKAMRVAVNAAMDYVAFSYDFVPDELNAKYHLPSLQDSLRLVHWPEPGTNLQALLDATTREQKKLIFNEFFLLETGLALRRRAMKVDTPGSAMIVDDALMDRIRALLPFKLTAAQERALKEISGDMAQDKPMNRLLQGDVGSGKTAVALAAALIAVRNKKQAVIMAPTEILAVQHYKNITRILKDTKVRVELMTSGMSVKNGPLFTGGDGETHIFVGTHALIQGDVVFSDLGLAVVDEQHRFGVRQRAELMKKGENPHTLIMTATPIPRTLAMTVYGDLDVSVIDELPPGRTPVETKIYTPAERGRALDIVRREVGKGRQAYIIYPLIEESEKVELKAAATMFEHLKNEDLAGLRLGLTHGRMKSAEKDMMMDMFGRRELDILVSTTVIEVGIDFPNATVMMIEHAERFGLSQLHQLRGRVGRGKHKSHCLLMAECKRGMPAWERLKVMEKYQDGFKIAEEDLEIRGAGDFFGAKQSGLPEFKIGNIIRDHKILAEARRMAFDIVEKDPKLTAPEHQNLKRALLERWQDRFELGDVG